MRTDAEEKQILVKKVISALKGRGLSQEQVEERCLLATGRISKWLVHGEPSARQLWRIAQHLGVDIGYFLDPDRTVPGMPESDRYELAYRLVRRLGPEEAERRLLREDRPPSGEPGPGYAQGHPVDESRASRRKGSA